MGKQINRWGQTEDICDQSQTWWDECNEIQMEVAQREKLSGITQNINPMIEPVIPQKMTCKHRKINYW